MEEIFFRGTCKPTGCCSDGRPWVVLQRVCRWILRGVPWGGTPVVGAYRVADRAVFGLLGLGGKPRIALGHGIIVTASIKGSVNAIRGGRKKLWRMDGEELPSRGRELTSILDGLQVEALAGHGLDLAR